MKHEDVETITIIIAFSILVSVAAFLFIRFAESYMKNLHPDTFDETVIVLPETEEEILGQSPDNAYTVVDNNSILQHNIHEAEDMYEHLAAQEGFIELPDTIYTYTGFELLDCYKGPTDYSTKVFRISSGAKVHVVGYNNGYYLIRSPYNTYGFTKSEQLLEGTYFIEDPLYCDLRELIPEAEFALYFSKTANITGSSLYYALPLLEKDTANKLRAACDMFLSDGYQLIIHDAYRPGFAQRALWEVLPNPAYISDPYVKPSAHSTGTAVDISLCDMDGKELVFPTEVYAFEELSNRNNSAVWDLEARKNVVYMTNIMKQAGFTTTESMWWHFENMDAVSFMEPEIDYELVEYVQHSTQEDEQNIL